MGGGAEPKSRPSRLAFHHRQCPHETETFVSKDSCLTEYYIYFQIPLMVLIMAPAFEGMRREWREAAESLGANGWQYWRYVGLPILLPSILGTTVLLFGNTFGAHATAFQLTGGSQGNVVTILIGAQISSDALANPGLGNALALGMIVIMGVSIGLYTWLQRLSARWLRS